MVDDSDLPRIKAVLQRLVPDPDDIDDETWTAIVRGDHVIVEASEGSGLLDPTDIIHLLQTYAPTVSALFSICNITYGFIKDRTKKKPSAKELATKYQEEHPGDMKTRDDVVRIAEFVLAETR